MGKAIRVGPKVTLIKEGERVGVGAQAYACLECRQCKHDNETYCKHQLDTYGSVWPDSGVVSQGGYSSHVRTHEHWYVGPSASTLSVAGTDGGEGSSPYPMRSPAPWRRQCSAPA